MNPLHVAGYTWYCQIPGKLWVTNPELNYRLQYRHHKQKYQGVTSGWWITGNGLDERLSGNRQLKIAMRAAAPLMEGTV
jgi:hypothetical protein